MTTLHYIYDPLCGWCYGATPLMRALLDLPDLRFVLHGGGMMAGDAHYVEGRRVASAAVLLQLAGDMNLDPAAFGAAFERLTGQATDSHIEQSRQVPRLANAEGFPTVAIEGRDGRLSRLQIGRYHGQAGGWVEAVQRAMELAH